MTLLTEGASEGLQLLKAGRWYSRGSLAHWTSFASARKPTHANHDESSGRAWGKDVQTYMILLLLACVVLGSRF